MTTNTRGAILGMGIVAVIAAALTWSSGAALAQAQSGAGTTYQVDNVHSSVIFAIRHAGVGRFYGRFNELKGDFSYNQDSDELGRIRMEVAVDSIDTNNKLRDSHLTASDFFNSRQFPAISFQSTRVQKVADGRFRVTGDFEMHGQTHPITAEVEWLGVGEFRGKALGGFEARFELDRTKWGLTKWSDGTLGNSVELIVSVEGNA